MEEVDESNQMLVVVVDVNPNQLLFARNTGSFSRIMNSVITFLNSHLMLHSTNRIALLASHSSGCSYLYPDPSEDTELLRQRDGQYEVLYQVETVVRRRLKAVLSRDMNLGSTAGAESLLSGGLAMALTYINRVKMNLSPAEKINPRLLVISSTGDSAAQYINYMNVFFTAQKLSYPLDVCMLGTDSGLLQQGSDITGGVYLKVENIERLLQYLVWMFLPSPPLRSMLGAPPPVKVDYRAACFCHRQLVDVGYVCSVCLSIFCRFNPVCTTCHSVFAPPKIIPKKKRDGGKKT
ncbi:general transcription factor IIH subunit 3 [Eurytemora carolleeae]|uniref:general transcription factor IIH subunit 3 n=1 Tax=Eurytemora carolleeae TaxID=1294199 RepID=UPI000C7578B1|nr:general transcription factor IIH subunit 3 [Eurytemora carolleeae]|eukprot:XP_023342456.1 general transcription factor IIH subunit 3-like [Eurytemora affinis]